MSHLLAPICYPACILSQSVYHGHRLTFTIYRYRINRNLPKTADSGCAPVYLRHRKYMVVFYVVSAFGRAFNRRGLMRISCQMRKKKRILNERGAGVVVTALHYPDQRPCYPAKTLKDRRLNFTFGNAMPATDTEHDLSDDVFSFVSCGLQCCGVLGGLVAIRTDLVVANERVGIPRWSEGCQECGSRHGGQPHRRGCGG